MRMVHTSDWHIGKIVNGFSMLPDQRYILERLTEYLAQTRPDVLLVSGDLYDRSIPPAEAVTLLDEVLFRITNELQIPVIAISGNHDSPQRLAFASRLYARSGLYLEGIYHKEVRKITLKDEFGPVNFFCLPYIEPALVRVDLPGRNLKTQDSAFRAVIEQNLGRIDRSERNVLLAHGFFSYLKNIDAVELSGSEVSIGGSDLIDAKTAEIFDYVALGHLHRPQNVGIGSIRYSGAPLKYSASEASGKKSVVVVQLREKGNLKTLLHELDPLHDMRVLTGSFEQLLAGPTTQDYIFAQVTDDSLIPNAMERLRAVYPNAMGLRMAGREREYALDNLASASLEQRSTEDLFSDFYRSIKDEDISARRRELVAEVVRQVEHGA